ncbi:MAG: HEAT repeat domain-containing protein, partial [Phycisphaerales bacterium]|nr:HEAT repeat domain-containing protein [Phycisphaerales bacterium]
GRAADLRGTLGRPGGMMDLSEDRFGVPYRGDRNAHLCVKNFGAGGMENTSATSLYPSAVLTETARRDRDLDSLIAHELAHQWTGDLLTCKTWAHIWLNEGWATYGESLWFEHRDGPDGYFDDMRDNFRVARRDRTDTNDTPMVSPAYDSPDDVFGRAANPYPKGASILHMLRMELGEHDFWAGVRQYMNERADDVVETNDLRYALEASSGRSLEHFFEQWCYRPGTPDLHVDVRFDGRDRALEIEVEQRQQMSIVTPAFVFTLPVHVRTASGWTVHEIDVDSRLTSYRVVLDGPPDVVAVDPELHVLKTVEVDKPFAMWMAQIDAGPTVVARHAAIDAIGERDEPEVAARLAGLIRDESVRHTLRITAARALAGLGSRHARATFVELVDAPIDEPRVRRALVDGLAGVDREIAVSRLLDAAAADASEACRVAAIRGLARHRATEATSLLVDLVNVPSQHDDIRRAALDALADLDASEGLDRAIECAAYGHLDRARPTAIATMATLAHHDTERVVPLLVGYLDDPEGRTVNAAIDALGRVNTDESRQALQRVADTSVDAGRRRRAERALESPGGEGRRRRGG